ncbi:heterokaryon incompatibility protein-domain-containing protein [Hypoxylon rubiginosum]|uniref:Heterokaryon incompatibility protein-domain-containing protein n=1 Tax=Hypoxylon rubiginosum TaxID=110542 RepID=A0ACC0DKX2_9PEZI|nr:heterokaryon incompatibility protein-domain-containing protein [Hypoxylon rubiginosum]
MSIESSGNLLSDSSGDPVPWLEDTAIAFHYDPLEMEGNCQRLLELEPSLSPEDPIRCRLFHTKNYEAHQYEILSCDWRASSEAPVPISLNGQTFDVPVEIWKALQRVRLEDEPRLLFTEGICINQRFGENETCDEERNWQIGKLNDIYKAATGLLVWLGATENNSNLVFEHLDRCRGHNHLNWCTYRGETEEAFRQLCKRSLFYNSRFALELFFSKKATLLCGRYESKWPEPLKCSTFLPQSTYYHPLEGPDGPTYLRSLQDYTGGRCRQVRNLFLWSRHCRTDDPRDKVFAAMATDAPTGIAETHCKDHVGVFRDFTRDVIESRQDLEVLHWFGTRKQLEGLPSWVPDYSIVNPVGTLPRVFDQAATYSVHYPLKLLPEYGFFPGNVLSVRGRFIEKIDKVADELKAEETTAFGSEEFSNVFRGWEELALKLTKTKRFPQSVVDAFSDTVTGRDEVDLLVESDQQPYVRRTRPMASRMADMFNRWYRNLGTGVLWNADSGWFEKAQADGSVSQSNDGFYSEQRNEEQVKAIVKKIEQFARQLEITCYGRKFFITSKGSMGLAPPHAEEKDDIVFFPGGKYPFVLRARDDGTYELIGDCFLYDLDVFALFQDQHNDTREFLLT